MSDLSDSDDSETRRNDDENDLTQLEQEVQNEHLNLERGTKAAPPDAEGDEPPSLNKVEQEFGVDTGMVSYATKDGEDFFFVTANSEITAQRSYFEASGQSWQAMKFLPTRLDVDGKELPSDENDPEKTCAEMYVPGEVDNWPDEDRHNYLVRGYNAIREYFGFDKAKVSSAVHDHTGNDNNKMPSDSSKDSNTVVDKVTTAIESLANSLDKKDKKEESAKKQEVLANKVFEALDPNIPKMHKTTMVLAEPIPPALVGLQQKNRRLTGASWRQIRLEHYNLSPEQLSELSPILKLAPTPEDEALTAAMSPPLASALAELLKKNADFHLPTMKLFNLLWQLTTKDQEYGKKLNEFVAFRKDADGKFMSDAVSAVEVKDILDIFNEMFIMCQHQVMTNSLLSYQMKQQIANLVTSTSKNKATHKMISQTIQSNLDENPRVGLLGNVSKTVKNFNATQKVMAKAGIQVGAKRNAELSLTSDAPAKRPRNIHVSIRDTFPNRGNPRYVSGGNPRYASGSGGKGGGGDRRYSTNNGGNRNYDNNRGGYGGDRNYDNRGGKGGGGRGGNRGGNRGGGGHGGNRGGKDRDNRR